MHEQTEPRLHQTKPVSTVSLDGGWENDATLGVPDQHREMAMAESVATSDARRKLIRGALAAGPVVLALRGRSAMAGTGCSSSTFIGSGNLSPGHKTGICTTGFSPGYWKVCQHFSDWGPSGKTPGTFSGTCTSGMPKGTQLTPGSLFNQFPPFVISGTLGPYSAWRILAYPTNVDKQLEAFNIVQIQLARHLIASYLNLKKVGSAFPVTEPQLKKMWEEGSMGGYCPIGTGCTATQLWNAQTLICYLRNYTMDQTTVSSDPITWVCTGI